MTTVGDSNPAGAVDSNPLEDALTHLQCVVVARRTRTNPEHVTWQQYDVLENLRLRGRMTPSQLSDSLGVSRQSMSKALRFLKDRELVAQIADGTDRRELTTTLTDEGREFLSRAADSRRAAAAVARTVLTPGEQSIFAELCQKVADALYDHTRTPLEKDA
ncbi:MarR family winged helix-turn-helix transcriptional regulator [Umezawaea endophytica]|uniref:MarR family transcriptional regulator n=1 Tax=Umezawaea endophytica TaxID=1654476 RepID=A0A9X3AEE0_9PSEU|nr:MarR family transcriptional regulator [Umezawaea endophytica]MCS7476731.1 MarR family transcriptional regulator [Umezawaea endophytica]